MNSDCRPVYSSQKLLLSYCINFIFLVLRKLVGDMYFISNYVHYNIILKYVKLYVCVYMCVCNNLWYVSSLYIII